MSLDVAHVELMLHEIAEMLAELPIDDTTHPFHLRALALKRLISAAGETRTTASAHDALDIVRELHAEVLVARARSGVHACAKRQASPSAPVRRRWRA